MRYLLFAAVTILATGCLSERKVSRWNQEHPRQAAEYCAATFPTRPGDTTTVIRIDTTEYVRYRDSVIGQIGEDLDSAGRVELLLQLRKLYNNAPAKTEYRDHYIPWIDSAALKACRLQQQDLQATITKLLDSNYSLEKKLLTAQAKAAVRLWMFIAAAVAVILLAVLLFKKSKLF